MEAKLKEMFPAGEWGLGQRSWMVKSGTYFHAAAEIVDGSVVITPFGASVLAPAARETAPEAIEIPSFVPEAVEEAPKPVNRVVEMQPMKVSRKKAG